MRASALNLFSMIIYALLLLQVFPTICSLKSIEINENYPDERNVLLKLRDAMESSSNLHGNWTGPPCYKNQSRWAGIGCFNWHVTAIVLDGIHLTGSLPQPPSFLLQRIKFLTKLSLRNNSIHGPLPSLADLSYLQYVLISQNRFSGPIPADYIRLPKLTKLELQQNSLDGSIPPFDQPSLTVFNVSNNHLQGPIPPTQVLQKFPKSSFDNNTDLCGQPLGTPCPISPPPPPPPSAPPATPSQEKNKGKLQIWSIGLIAAAAALVPFSLIMVFFFCYYKRRHRKETQHNQHPGKAFSRGRAAKRRNWEESLKDPERTVELEFFDKERPVFDLDELLRASAEVIGKGNLGTTYKAVLESGSVVAVKRLRDMSTLSKREFVQHMQLLGSMRHENLVEIISFYYSKDEKLLISEFIPNGNLFELLHENRGVGRVPLNWNARLSIIIEIAKGLAFLHQSLPSHKVPHGNLKSSNVVVLRDRQNFHSKLTDFGLLPLVTSCRSSQKLAITRTPEFSQGKKLTHKADVYCFGIILLEVVTGRSPSENSRASNEGSVNDLSDWVRAVVNNDWSTDILDLEIVSAREEHNNMLRLTEIALECTDMMPQNRPKMSQVLTRIQEMEQQQGHTQISESMI